MLGKKSIPRNLRIAVVLLCLTGAFTALGLTAGPGLAQGPSPERLAEQGWTCFVPPVAGSGWCASTRLGPAADPVTGAGRSCDVHGDGLDARRRVPGSYPPDPSGPVRGTDVRADGRALRLQPAHRLLRVQPLLLETDLGGSRAVAVVATAPARTTGLNPFSTAARSALNRPGPRSTHTTETRPRTRRVGRDERCSRRSRYSVRSRCSQWRR